MILPSRDVRQDGFWSVPRLQPRHKNRCSLKVGSVSRSPLFPSSQQRGGLNSHSTQGNSGALRTVVYRRTGIRLLDWPSSWSVDHCSWPYIVRESIAIYNKDYTVLQCVHKTHVLLWTCGIVGPCELCLLLDSLLGLQTLEEYLVCGIPVLYPYFLETVFGTYCAEQPVAYEKSKLWIWSKPSKTMMHVRL